MSRPVRNVTVTTTWSDGFKSGVSGDALTATRKTIEALRRAGVPIPVILAPTLRDATQAVSVGEDPERILSVGRCTLTVTVQENRP